MNDHCKRRLFIVSLFIVSLLIPLAFAGSVVSQSVPTGQSTAYPRNQALYVPVQDGTKIAIDVWLPENLAPGTKVPTITRATPYHRAAEVVDRKLVANLPPIIQDINDLNEPSYYNNAGYALVQIDLRGRGASFGTTSTGLSPNEIKDYSDIVDWIVAQPWSNHKVGATGISYNGTSAEMLALVNNPAVKAIVPRFNDFDVYAQFVPGGLLNAAQTLGLGESLLFLDASPCSFNLEIAECEGVKQTGLGGVKPVDADPDKQLLAQAVQQHATNLNLGLASQQVTFRDDAFDKNLTLPDISPYNFKAEIERSNVAIYSWAGWLDGATASGTVSRFMTFRNPQKAVIGPWNHGAFANPFLPALTPVQPSIEEQYQSIIQFFDTYLKDQPGKQNRQRELRYYTMNENQWKTTDVWPPKGVTPRRLFFAAQNGLTRAKPNEQTGEDQYNVNFEATTGPGTRWYQVPTSRIEYGNREEEDKKLLVYNSNAIENAIEITGNPVVNLWVSSTADDGAFIVYLEDVDPNGNVTYVTEGQLRPLHRKVSPEAPPYDVFGPYHSFKKQDGLPLNPGEVTQLTFELLPTSVRIQKGHHIRVAIAGHDKDTFARYPAAGNPTLSVQRNAIHSSSIDLPVMNSQ
jgi:uncharacterized protein